MAKRSKKILGSKKLGKALRKHPYGAAAALIALGGLASAYGARGRLLHLKDRASRKLSAVSDAWHEDETKAAHSHVAT